MSTATPTRGVHYAPFIDPASLRLVERDVPTEAGVPSCAEDAAEAILRRPRVRSRYARMTNALAKVWPN